ncbi:hypothetical protein [Hymenobacter sp. UYP22]|uniref:hypothetical protein n=1 Tax=Hymenobacter sp. UYP22 TaxID=3156348 RepID=UPI00339467DF
MDRTKESANQLVELLVTIDQFVDDFQPGWVRGLFNDIDGKQWSIIEKVPVVTKEDLDKHSSYPVQGFIACQMVESSIQSGREVVVIDLSRPYSICAEDGTEVFQVFREQLIETYQ